MAELSEVVRPSFVAAGWEEGRLVAVSSAIPADHPAAMILAEFSGLTVEPPGEGEECAPHVLTFKELWPDPSILQVWSELLGTRVAGIAELDHGHGELYIDADGRCFGRSCMHDAFWLQGGSFSEALERALLGRRSKPLLRPDQASVTLYGDRFTADSSQVYRYM